MLPALFAARAQRVRPGLDDKVLLGWNALFLALARRGRGRARPRRLDGRGAHERRGSCSRELRRDDGRLLRSWQDGRANLLAYAEDYAALLEALLTLAELDDVAWLGEARAVADDLLAPVRRRRTAAASSPPAPTPRRSSCGPKDFQDNATPSENSLAADGLLRLAALTGDADDAPAAPSGGSRTLAPVLGEHPTAFAYLLEALERVVTPPLEVAIVGDAGADRDALVDVAAHPRAARHRCASPPRPASAPTSPRCSPTARSSTASLRPTCASTSPAGCPSPTPTALRAQLDARR